MTDGQLQIPVGAELSRSDFRRIGLDNLRDRAILLDEYASLPLIRDGITPEGQPFNWRNYINLNLSTSVETNIVARTLDQFSRTPEGRQAIYQASLMHEVRKLEYHELASIPSEAYPGGSEERERRPPSFPDRLTITSDYSNGFSPRRGTIRFNLEDIYSREFLGTDGNYYDLSPQNTLFHEILHAADSFGTTRNFFNYYEEFNLSRAPRETNSRIQEFPAMEETNQFMWQRYREPSRALIYTLWNDRNEFRTEPDAEKFIVTQENLGADHFYDDIRAPSLPVIPSTRTR